MRSGRILSDPTAPHRVRLLHSYCNRERETARLSRETNAAIVADYQSGMKSTEIARKHQINEWTVHHRLKRAGITKRPTSMSEEEIELTISPRADGLTYDRIAAGVGFSTSTVRNVLTRAGR